MNSPAQIVSSSDTYCGGKKVILQPVQRTPILPDTCPCCGGAIGKKANTDGTPSTHDYCLNPECEGKSKGKIKKWLKVHKVLGIGDGLLDTLLERGVKSLFDLYGIDETVLASMPMGAGMVGSSRAAAICRELRTKTHAMPLHQFLGSLGIPFIGRRKATLMIDAANGQLDNLEDWTPENLVDLAPTISIGGTVETIAEWFTNNQELIEGLAAIVQVQSAEKTQEKAKETPVVEGGHVFLLTGKFEVPKKEIHAKILAAGHSFVEDFTSTVTHLVQSDPSSTSSKTKKALARGIPVVGIDELGTLLQS